MKLRRINNGINIRTSINDGFKHIDHCTNVKRGEVLMRVSNTHIFLGIQKLWYYLSEEEVNEIDLDFGLTCNSWWVDINAIVAKALGGVDDQHNSTRCDSCGR